MKIERIDIKNFRKLKDVKVKFDEETTLLVGANNSGKTSAIEALCKFFKHSNRQFSFYDLSVTNWDHINKIGEYIVRSELYNESEFMKKWYDICPTLDVWFKISENELHYVTDVIPTLDWEIGTLGLRLIFLPSKVEELYSEFKNAIENKRKWEERKENIKLWPCDLSDFLKQKIKDYFSIRYFTLDPRAYDNSVAVYINSLEELETNPLKKMVKIDIIPAQRGLSDTNEGSDTNESSGKLSKQLRDYFDNQLDPRNDNISEEDLEFLFEAGEAEDRFDERLKKSFEKPINELRDLGYPGFTDPKIHISTKIKHTAGLNHSSAVQYSTTKADEKNTRLPEKYSGLGYQNLIFIVFELMSFRDKWMRKGKDKQLSVTDNIIQPLHLVVIEEPEAHLHVQVQQVFIRKAYGVLRNSENLQESEAYSSQLLVSTHSSHIVESLNYSKLRYFRRCQTSSNYESPKSEVVDLALLFGSENATTRFVSRYLKAAHSNLFFADIAILIEGSAERMLLPEFITRSKLNSAYLTILEIGGSHAHRLKPLIEALGIATLIITDLDSFDPVNSKKAYPERSKGYTTKNNTLLEWIPALTDLDELLNLTNSEKSKENVYVAYQNEVKIKGIFDRKATVLGSTFEDSLILENTSFFNREIQKFGQTKKVRKLIEQAKGLKSLNREVYKVVSGNNFKKAEFSLDILMYDNLNNIKTPQYISDGIKWLETKWEVSQISSSMSKEVEEADV